MKKGMRCIECGRHAVFEERDYDVCEGAMVETIRLRAYWCECGEIFFDEQGLDAIQEARTRMRAWETAELHKIQEPFFRLSEALNR